jgi:hypothetical protein
VFLCMRVLLVRLSWRNLVSLWPIVLGEVTKVITSAVVAVERERERERDHEQGREREWVLVHGVGGRGGGVGGAGGVDGAGADLARPHGAVGVAGGGSAGGEASGVFERAMAALKFIDLALVQQPDELQVMQVCALTLRARCLPPPPPPASSWRERAPDQHLSVCTGVA